MVKAYAKSDIGKAREVNQDSYYIIEDKFNSIQLFILADGMGGCNAGEVASKMAAKRGVGSLIKGTDPSFVSGRVIDIVIKTSRDLDGKIFVKKLSSSSSSACLEKNVKIRYNPNNPNQYYAQGNYTKLILGVTFTIVGLIAVVTIHS